MSSLTTASPLKRLVIVAGPSKIKTHSEVAASVLRLGTLLLDLSRLALKHHKHVRQIHAPGSISHTPATPPPSVHQPPTTQTPDDHANIIGLLLDHCIASVQQAVPERKDAMAHRKGLALMIWKVVCGQMWCTLAELERQQHK